MTSGGLLNAFLQDLCQDTGRALGCPHGIEGDFDAVDVNTDMAIPLALIVNELVTNAIKHVGPPCVDNTEEPADVAAQRLRSWARSN